MKLARFRTFVVVLVIWGMGPSDAGFAAAARKSLSQAKSSEVSRRERNDARDRFDARVEALARFATGHAYELNRKSDEALEQFLKSVKADPNNHALTADVARRLLVKRKFKDAISLLEKALKKKEGTAQIYSVLALAYQQTKKTERALDACAKSLAKNPRSILPYRILVQIHTVAKEPTKALAVLKAAAAVETTTVPFMVEIAGLIKGVLEKTPAEYAAHRPMLLEVIKKAVARKPRQPVLLQRLAEMSFYAKDYAASAKLYLALANRYPDSGAFRRRLVEIYLKGNDKDGAVIQLETILRERPTDPQANLILGILAEEENDYEKAIDHYRKTKDSARKDPRAYFDIARLNLALGKPDETLKVLDEAGKQFRQTFSAEFYRGMAHAQKKAYDKALQFYTSAEILGKQDEPGRLQHFFYFQYGVSAERNQDFKQAERHFLKCLELEPESADALNYLGYMWAERGQNLEQAKSMIERAVAQEPENAAFLDSMGWVLYMMGKPRASLPWLLKSIENTKVETEEDPTLFDHAADAYFKVGDYRNALKYYGLAVKIQAKPEIIDKLETSKKRLKDPS
jgi:tetratricopeptide (TPR) repeat protein